MTTTVRHKLIVFVVFIVALGILYYVLHDYLTLETVVDHETRLRNFVVTYPVRAFALAFVLYVLMSFIPATTGKSIVYGWLFGFWSALVQVNFALTVTAILSLLFSRYVFRDAVQSRFGFYLDRFNRAMGRDGAYLVITLRLLHAPYTFVNYAMGATPIRTKTFWWSTQLGMLPSNIVFVLAGAQLPTLAELAKHGVHSVLTWQIVAAFALLSVFPLLIHWLVKRIRSQYTKGAAGLPL
jgi:uncharacterized membrane protein YdjX (TVP38/TMEM64 family)